MNEEDGRSGQTNCPMKYRNRRSDRIVSDVVKQVPADDQDDEDPVSTPPDQRRRLTCSLAGRCTPDNAPSESTGIVIPRKEQSYKEEAWYEERGIVNPKCGSSDGASRDQLVRVATVESSLVEPISLPTSPQHGMPLLPSRIEINPNLKSTQPAITVGDLVRHFQQRELTTEFAWRTFSTRNGYECNLRK